MTKSTHLEAGLAKVFKADRDYKPKNKQEREASARLRAKMGRLPNRVERAGDDRLLDWMALRAEGKTTPEIGALYGKTSVSIRVATNRVVDADAKHHNDRITFAGVAQ